MTALVTLGLIAAALVLLAAAIIAAAAALFCLENLAARRAARDESKLGSDEEFARELLAYQPSHYPMHRRNGGDRPEDPVA